MLDVAPAALVGCLVAMIATLGASTNGRQAPAARPAATGVVVPSAAAADTTYDAGRTSGADDARERGEWGSALRGLVGGTLAGPLGAALAYRSVDEEVELAPPQRRALRNRDSLFVAGYRTGFSERLVERRRERALLGGIAGTGIFLAVVIHLVDLGGESADGLPPSATPN